MSRRNHAHQMDAFLGNTFSNLTGDATSNNIVSPVANPTPYPTAPPVGLNGKPLAVENLQPTPVKTPRNPSTVTTMPINPITTVTQGEPIAQPRTPRPSTIVNVSSAPTTTPTILTPIAIIPASSLNPVVTSDHAPISMPSPLGGGGGGGGGGASDESSQKVASGGASAQPSFMRRNWLPLILVAGAIYVFIKKPLNKK